MSEHMKTLPTKTAEIHFLGPVSNRLKAIEILEELGFHEISEMVSFEEAFPDHHPGRNIVGYRRREGLTQKELSQATGIPQPHISEMENNRRPIGKKNAKILAKVLKTDYRMFL